MPCRPRRGGCTLDGGRDDPASREQVGHEHLLHPEIAARPQRDNRDRGRGAVLGGIRRSAVTQDLHTCSESRCGGPPAGADTSLRRVSPVSPARGTY